jgi:hypothetical protein
MQPQETKTNIATSSHHLDQHNTSTTADYTNNRHYI